MVIYCFNIFLIDLSWKLQEESWVWCHCNIGVHNSWSLTDVCPSVSMVAYWCCSCRNLDSARFPSHRHSHMPKNKQRLPTSHHDESIILYIYSVQHYSVHHCASCCMSPAGRCVSRCHHWSGRCRWICSHYFGLDQSCSHCLGWDHDLELEWYLTIFHWLVL